ncbi:MAG TPA: lipopolysaccharide biosynthesis protein [Prolixibacteraceae bacterium]|nr:lipopolysaccharide biosynthesis protein [Prolixibacteraceae bacterium]
MIWSSVERFSVQGIQFLIMIIMARLLLPSDYGLIGMLAIFIAISQSFIDSGFSNALIRKSDRTEIDFSTVFYFNIIVGVCFYLLLFFASSKIALFYKAPQLENITKIVAINLLINSLTVVQRAKFTIEVDFKSQAKASVLSVIISGVLGIWMAYTGYGVWALVTQTVVNSTINMIFLWYYAHWIPAWIFSFKSFKEMFTFGSKLLLAGLLDTTYKNIYTIVIGKKFSVQDLGYFTRADQFAQFPSSNVTGIIGRVTFPILSSIQHDEPRLQSVYRKYLRMSAFIVFPLMVGLAALAHPFVLVVLTAKWEGVVILLQIICFAAMWYPIHAINLNLLQVKGRSDLFLRLEIIKKTLGVITLLITIPLGIVAMCIGMIFSSFLALIVNTHYTGKLINVGFLKQMGDLLPILAYAFSMGGFVWWVIQFLGSDEMRLFMGSVIGVVYYYIVTYFTRSGELKELLLLVKQ